MDIRRLGVGDEALAEAFLLKHDLSSFSLLANLAAGLAHDGGGPRQGIYVGGFHDGELIGVVAHFHRNLVFQAPESVADLAAAALRESRRPAFGLIGPWEQVSTARSMPEFLDRPARVQSKEVLYFLSLDRMRMPRALLDGSLVCRQSREEDFPSLVDFGIAEIEERLGERSDDNDRAEIRSSIELAHGPGDLFVLAHNGRLVATALFHGRAHGRVQVGGVYTLPDQRGRGYARAVVAGALAIAHAVGIESAVLFTGEANHAAQRAYESLGFAPVGDYGVILFRD